MRSGRDPRPPKPPRPRLRRKYRFRPWRRDRGFVERVALAGGGGLLLAVGVAGILLPVLPGWPFLAPALVLLASVSRRTRYGLHLLLNRCPRIDRTYLRMRGAHRKAAVGGGQQTSEPRTGMSTTISAGR